jgi:hypothetical protein
MAATILQNHPLATTSSVACILTALALGPTPAFIPLVCLVAVLRVGTRLILPRPHATRRLAILTAFVTLGTSIAYGAEGLTALSSMAGSLAALTGLSTAFSSATIIPFVVASKFDMYQNPFIFPAIWASVWSLVSSLSPVGRLGAWSPMLGVGGYTWTRPYLGAVGLDWILAAWAEITGTVFTVFLWGGDSSEYQPLEDQTQNPPNENQSNSFQQPNQSRPSRKKSSFLFLILFAIVCAGSIPSFSTDILPLPISSDGTVPLGLACALPTITSETQPIYSYLNETLRLAPLARIVLWPEGAVAFDSLQDRENKLEEVRKFASHNGIFIGVSFTEPLPEPMDTHDARHKMRNGMVLVNATGSVYEYYKRNLVPGTLFIIRICVGSLLTRGSCGRIFPNPWCRTPLSYEHYHPWDHKKQKEQARTANHYEHLLGFRATFSNHGIQTGSDPRPCANLGLACRKGYV